MRGILLFLLFACLSSLTAQTELVQYTESEIAVQDKYVEAKKFMLIGRFEKAEKILIDLYKEDRENAAVAMELSKVYSYMEDPYNEHKYAQKANQNEPNNEYVMANYAYICMEQEKFDEAIPVLSTLVRIAPKNEEYTDKLATTHLQLNNAAAALKAYNELENKIGITENVSRRKFEIYEVLGDSKKATVELIKIAESNPSEVRFWHNLASYYNQLGKNKKALEVYRKILEVDINDADANMAITASDISAGDDNNYLRSLTPIIENSSIPVDRKILELIPYVDQLNENYDLELADALVMLSDKIATIHHTEAKAHALKGDILMSTFNAKGAAKAYEKTLSINDNVYLVWEGLLEAYTETGDHKNLLKVAINALDLFPNKPSAYMYYGRAHTLNNDLDEAIDVLQEGILVSGRDVTSKSNIYAELGRAHASTKDTKKANESIAKSLELSNNRNSLALDIQGDIFAKNGEIDKAIESWKLSQKMGNSSPVLADKIKNRRP